MNGDTSATYKLSDVSLEYDAIFDEPYPNVDPAHQGNIDTLPDPV